MSMDLLPDLDFSPRLKAKTPYRMFYRPGMVNEVTPEYLEKLRHRTRFTNADVYRLLAFIDQMLGGVYDPVKGKSHKVMKFDLAKTWDGKYRSKIAQSNLATRMDLDRARIHT
jgi:hypothetical protein